jgi:REP element-mobilizing transposase RayT
MNNVTYDPARHHRRSTRLRGYDYSQPGAFSVTLCVRDRSCLFGEVVDGELRLNAAGLTIDRWWCALPRKFPRIVLDAWVVMPNHVHGVILLGANPATPNVSAVDEGGHTGPPLHERAPGWAGRDLGVDPAGRQQDESSRSPSLFVILQWFKTMTTNDYIAGVKHMDWPPFNRQLWQRGYHDRILRSHRELDRIRTYMANNPANWHYDEENPVATFNM